MKRFVFLFAACGANATPQPSPTPTLPSCVPDLDGTITEAELPIALGATLPFYVDMNRSVNLVAQNDLWDFSYELPDPTVVALGPVALDAQWYAASFPNGQFVVDAGAGLDGIYHQDAQALWLDGTASHDPAPPAGKTLVPYAQPIAMLRFPITDGDAYTTTAPLANVTIDGLPFVGTDTISVDITGTGELDLPYVDFSPVLRARTHLVRAATTGPSIATRTTAFLFECFGELAHADSKQDEPDPDFTTAATFRRYALGAMP